MGGCAAFSSEWVFLDCLLRAVVVGTGQCACRGLVEAIWEGAAQLGRDAILEMFQLFYRDGIQEVGYRGAVMTGVPGSVPGWFSFSWLMDARAYQLHGCCRG